jgi:hypothetical protein
MKRINTHLQPIEESAEFNLNWLQGVSSHFNLTIKYQIPHCFH